MAAERRASDRPIAIACFGFVTFLPLPLFSLPRLNSCISFSTFFCAFGPYLRPLLEDFFFAELPEDFEREELRCEPVELLFADAELRWERDDLLPLFFADFFVADRDLPVRDDEPDLLRDELFFRAIAIGSSLLIFRRNANCFRLCTSFHRRINRL